MALEAGGYAEKMGNKYEANWVAYQLFQLLDEKILSVIIEPLGDDEVGVDLVVEYHNGEKEYHQCKAGSANNEYWTLSQLNQANILKNASYQIQRGMNEFHLVSPLTLKRLSDLSDSALNTNGNATDFYKYQIKIGKQRTKDFNDLCDYLSLDRSKESDLKQALFFLQRFKVTPYVINKHTVSELEDKAVALFSCEPRKLLHFLKNYPVELNKLRVRITTHSLLKDLESSGFQPRIKPDDKRIIPVIERISEDFITSIKPYLIADSLIQRSEVNDIIGSLETHAVALIKAEAGMGKSALLLELHEKIQSLGAISIPIRLDRNRPENNADAFGKKLGFPYSPVLCLSRFATKQKTVLILDQLDAIRWTATHSNNALQVCQELVRQVLALRKEGIDINVILACRDFDLDEDVALSSWISGLNNEVSKINLSHFDANTVTQLIEPFEKYESLTGAKQVILTIPLWLNIYLVIAKKTHAAPQFINKLELVKQFWDNRIREIISLGVSEENAKQLIDEIVVLMNSKSRLSVSENVIAISSPQTLKALLSVGILTKQSQQISFRHQALFDYQVGIRLFNAALVSPNQLINEMGDYFQQTLTKREHLKYALNMLLDFDQSEFCANTLAILTSTKIRFHLKYLVFNSLKELTTLKHSAKRMIDRMVADSEFLPHFISHSCYHNLHIIQYLSDSGAISNWLNGEDDVLIDKAVGLLRSIAEKAPDTVLKELTLFIGKSAEWNNRVYSGLCWDMENDSDAMFEVRKKLIKLGCHAGFVQWKVLAKKVPNRTLDLIEILLHHYKEALCGSSFSVDQKIEKLTHKDTWSDSDLYELNNISSLIPEDALSRLLAIVYDFIGRQNHENITYNWLYRDRHSSHEATSSIINGIFSIIESSGKKLSNTPNLLLGLLKPYLTSNNPIITYIVAKLLNHLPVEYSDLVVEWLLDEPKSRFTCGNTYIEPKWVLPGKLIAKFSVNCSDELFQQLEQTIYYFPPTKDIEKIKWRLEARRDGVYYFYWGETQYFLLPKLSELRIDIKTKALIRVLQRKFASYTDGYFCHANDSRIRTVTSPLPLGNYLSDNAWVKLILTSKDQVNKGKWNRKRGKNTITESSIAEFSRSLDTAAKNQPTRFANLALSLPSNIDKQYIKGFYYGLAETDVNRVTEQYRDEWELCLPELTEKVIMHFKGTDCEYQLVRILESRITEKGWSVKARNRLIDLAINAKDPEPNKLNIRNTEESEFATDADTHSLRNNAINCCRGIAYRGVSHLFWDDEELANELHYLIQSAIDDPHPAVNIVALDLLSPMLNYDESFAQKKFLTLCNKDLRMACGRGAHYFFNNGFEGDYQADFINLVLEMLDSPLDEVKKEAARQVFARWFFNDLFEEQLNQVMQGNEIFRKGVASVVAQFLQEDKYHDRLHKLPPIYAQLVNDENKEILRTVGGCISGDNFWNKTISKELFKLFVGSEAALYSLYKLFNAIEKHSGNLLKYQNQLLQLVDNITSSAKTDKPMRAMHIRESTLINVLQRLYDEATEDEDSNAITICLDIWDKLLHSEIYSAINVSKELEKGLLS